MWLLEKKRRNAQTLGAEWAKATGKNPWYYIEYFNTGGGCVVVGQDESSFFKAIKTD